MQFNKPTICQRSGNEFQQTSERSIEETSTQSNYEDPLGDSKIFYDVKAIIHQCYTSTIYEGSFIGKQVAVKVFETTPMNQEQIRCEVATYMLCGENVHKNILSYFHMSLQPGKMIFIVKLCNTNLKQFIGSNRKCIKPALISNRDILTQLSSGVRCLHENNMLHRNLLPEKILLSTSGKSNVTIKMGGFGKCKILSPIQKTSKVNEKLVRQL